MKILKKYEELFDEEVDETTFSRLFDLIINEIAELQEKVFDDGNK